MKIKNIILVLTVVFPTVGSAQVSLSLEDCIEMAVENDVTVRNAELDVICANARKSEAFTYYFPKIEADAFGFMFADPLLTITANDVLGTSSAAEEIAWYFNALADVFGINSSYSLPRNGYSATLSLMQPVYAGGRIVNGNRLASLGVRAAQLRKSMAGRGSVESVEEKYWKAVSLEDRMEVVGYGLKMLDTLCRDAEAAYGAGLALERDVLEVRKEQSSLKAQQSKLRSGIRLAKMDLLNTIGMDYSVLLPVTEGRGPYIDDIHLSDRADAYMTEPSAYYRDPEEVMASMEESELLELSVRRHELQKKVILADALPQVGVGASYGYGRLAGDPQWNGAVYATVSIPLTDWSRTVLRLRQEEALKQKAINDRQHIESQLLLKTRQQWEEVLAAWNTVGAAQDEADLMKLLEDQLSADYKAGTATLSSLLKAGTDLRSAESDLNDARIAYRLAVSRYLKD